MASADNSVIDHQTGRPRSICSRRPSAGSAAARASISLGPGDRAKVMTPPTARKATSFTTDSKAIAVIRPGWCSLAVMSRTPKRIVKTAMNPVMKSVVPLQKLAAPALPPIALPGDREEQADIGQRHGDDQPLLHADVPFPGRGYSTLV